MVCQGIIVKMWIRVFSSWLVGVHCFISDTTLEIRVVLAKLWYFGKFTSDSLQNFCFVNGIWASLSVLPGLINQFNGNVDGILEICGVFFVLPGLRLLLLWLFCIVSASIMLVWK